MTKKRFSIVLIILTSLIIVVWLIWYFALKTEKTPAPISGVNFTVPEKNFGGSNLKTISEGPVVSSHQNNDGTILFYDFAGQLWRLNKNDSKPALLDQAPIKNIAEVIWSTNTKNIVKSGTNFSDSLYTISDHDQKSLFNLKTDTESATFSPDAKKIIYQVSSNSVTNSLFISDSNGKNQKTLVKDFRLRDIILNWHSVNNISVTSKPSGIVAGSLWFLDVKNLNIAKIIDGLFGLEALFAPDGKSFIYSFTDQNGKNPILVIYDKNGNKKIVNNVSTLIDKCVWDRDSINIYCAIPSSWPDSAVLPDNYYKNTFSTNDIIWKINTETGKKTLIFENIGSVSNLIVSNDESNFFFISKDNQFLIRLNVK